MWVVREFEGLAGSEAGVQSQGMAAVSWLWLWGHLPWPVLNRCLTPL